MREVEPEEREICGDEDEEEDKREGGGREKCMTLSSTRRNKQRNCQVPTGGGKGERAEKEGERERGTESINNLWFISAVCGTRQRAAKREKVVKLAGILVRVRARASRLLERLLLPLCVYKCFGEFERPSNALSRAYTCAGLQTDAIYHVLVSHLIWQGKGGS